MDPQDNIEEKPKTEEPENNIIEESPKQDEPKNEIIDEQKLLNEIKDYSSKNLYIITKELEEKIPYILSYIQNPKNEIANKKDIIKYFFSLIKNIRYNLEILLLSFRYLGENKTVDICRGITIPKNLAPHMVTS